jgi:hypothetical protein
MKKIKYNSDFEKKFITDNTAHKLINGTYYSGKTDLLLKCAYYNFMSNYNIIFITKQDIDSYYLKHKIEKKFNIILKKHNNIFTYIKKNMYVKIFEINNNNNFDSLCELNEKLCILIDDINSFVDYNDIDYIEKLIEHKTNNLVVSINENNKSNYIDKKLQNFLYFELNNTLIIPQSILNFSNFISNKKIFSQNSNNKSNEKPLLVMSTNRNTNLINILKEKINQNVKINDILIISLSNNQNIINILTDEINKFYKETFNLNNLAINLDYKYMKENFIDIKSIQNKTIISNFDNYKEEPRKYVIIVDSNYKTNINKFIKSCYFTNKQLYIIVDVNKYNNNIFNKYYNSVELFDYVNVNNNNTNIYPFIDKNKLNIENIHQTIQTMNNKKYKLFPHYNQIYDYLYHYFTFDNIYQDTNYIINNIEKQCINCLTINKYQTKNINTTENTFFSHIKCTKCNHTIDYITVD